MPAKLLRAFTYFALAAGAGSGAAFGIECHLTGADLSASIGGWAAAIIAAYLIGCGQWHSKTP
jgi:hypothetical protein